MRRSLANRTLAAGLVVVGLIAAVSTGVGVASAPSTQVLKSVDTALCPFKLGVTVTRNTRIDHVGNKTLQIIGPSTITLRNDSTGRAKTLTASGTYSVDQATGSIAFSGYQLWFFATGNHVPFLSLNGRGTMSAPNFVLSSTSSNDQALDPCALVAKAPISTAPVTTLAPWALPVDALGQMEYARLTPLLGNLIRHDHVHLDLLVNGKKVTIPAGVGLAEPLNSGPCPHGAPPQGDCATHTFFAGQVANSPIHTHTTSGIIHVESDRPGTFTLGQFFDEWGVRFSSSCLGGYCAGTGEELRVYVDGKRISSDPRGIVLTNHLEIAVVFGAPADFGSVPSTYTGGWPGGGCGGLGEPKCLP
ncbi:MAG TPA: hypothetical protein VMV08_06650 [Gaiellaceae bacterium]|nr:hypothetical protein [Gaiellaceae bacterium]